MSEILQLHSPTIPDLVTPSPAKSATSEELAIAAAKAADERKGHDIILLRVTKVSYLADYFLMVGGFSRAQVRAIAQAIEDKVAEECDRLPLRVEGKAEASWIVQDYGDAIIHIFMPQERDFYNLEAFWGHAERIDFLTGQPLLE